MNAELPNIPQSALFSTRHPVQVYVRIALPGSSVASILQAEHELDPHGSRVLYTACRQFSFHLKELCMTQDSTCQKQAKFYLCLLGKSPIFKPEYKLHPNTRAEVTLECQSDACLCGRLSRR
jgi:hypothetical protein